MSNLLHWARSGPDIAIRIVSGAGGSGKTRLAAEVAQTLRDEGWRAGVVRPESKPVPPVSGAGLFIAIDYPEGQDEAVS